MAIKDDSLTMRQIILGSPKYFRPGLKATGKIKIRGKFDGVLICAMGGSALPADIFQIWLEAYKIGLPLYIHRNYGIPEMTDKNHLVVCISYSGNTEETLSAFEEARAKKLKVAAITSGGKLAQLCEQYGLPAIIIPSDYPPRMATGFLLSALMKLLVNCGIIDNGLENIAALEKSLKPRTLEIQGKNLAKKIKGKLPVVYASERLRNLARIWKIKFNENSKIHSFYNYFPELNHNEINSYVAPANLHLLILKDETDSPQIQKRMDLTKEILEKRGFPVDIIKIRGKDILYKVFDNLLLSDWASYYLALELGHDSIPVKIVEELKKKMR
ncbi:MAG: bifunctional phosphoglucose/phosphomannose isomerase [Candidatus Nealsonbacteria bacterium]|nr:bifunctional phosphoglucose/phosphomannose isomerase [Candidatus Nealsonbacteria bacterium]